AVVKQGSAAERERGGCACHKSLSEVREATKERVEGLPASQLEVFLEEHRGILGPELGVGDAIDTSEDEEQRDGNADADRQHVRTCRLVFFASSPQCVSGIPKVFEQPDHPR